MIEVEIHTIRMNLMGSPLRAILLRELGQERQLPIFIHQAEADAILMELKGQKRARPLTHDLLKSCIAALGGELQYVLVSELRAEPGGGTFYAVLHVLQDGREIDIDARPSDSIALAVRTHVPIYVAESVMDEAGVYPSEDTETVKEQLSVFSDFVDSLDLGDLEE